MHKARKRFGQNFLTDSTVIQQIINNIGAGKNDHLVEIGPGKGAITRQLLPLCKKLDIIELDRDLIPILEKTLATSDKTATKLNIHSADALTFDFNQLQEDQKLRVVGNLPYNISTPLMFHLLENADCILDMHFMLQKEVVDRLSAKPNTKAYSKLSVMTQAQAQVHSLFEISPESFDPIPKVQSAFVRLIPLENPLIKSETKSQFQEIVSNAFAHRRKTLRNNLKKIIQINAANEVIDLSRRAETLTIEEFASLIPFLASN